MNSYNNINTKQIYTTSLDSPKSKYIPYTKAISITNSKEELKIENTDDQQHI